MFIYPALMSFGSSELSKVKMTVADSNVLPSRLKYSFFAPTMPSDDRSSTISLSENTTESWASDDKFLCVHPVVGRNLAWTMPKLCYSHQVCNLAFSLESCNEVTIRETEDFLHRADHAL